MVNRQLLDAEHIREKLALLPAWECKGQALERVYEGKTYRDALEKLNAIAELSEARDHHPDMLLEWKKLTVRYWTHTAGGVTNLDFNLACEVEKLLVDAEILNPGSY